MNRRFQAALQLTSVVLASCLLACGGGSGGGGSTPVPPAAADFSLQVAPGSLQIPAGGSGFITLTLARLNGFSSAVTITGVGFPAGVVISGTVPAGASTLQLPVVVGANVPPSAYTGLSLRAQAGTLGHDAPFSLTVAQALAPGQVRDDLVQAAGGHQTGGVYENQAVVREGVSILTARDASDGTRARHGFYPSGAPADR